MFKKLLKAGTTFTLLLGCYLGYGRAFELVVRQFKTERLDDGLRFVNHNARSKLEARALAERAFGRGHWTVTDDLKWTNHVSPGAEVLIHDAFSSIGVTLAILRHVLPSATLRYVDRTGSLARFQVGPPSRRDRLRILAELPWWIRNIAIKLALRVTRPFGGTTPDI